MREAEDRDGRRPETEIGEMHRIQLEEEQRQR
jgi:hypothetical protein